MNFIVTSMNASSKPSLNTNTSNEKNHYMAFHDSFESTESNPVGSMIDNYFGRRTQQSFKSDIIRRIRTFDNLMERALLNNFNNESFVEKNGQYVLEIDIPDNMANAIKITRTNKTVNIKGKIETVVDKSKDNYINKYTSVKSINKTFPIPLESVGNTISAK